MALAVPRDRAGTFEPGLVPKGARRAGGLDEMIISLYAGGMTVRDIHHHWPARWAPSCRTTPSPRSPTRCRGGQGLADPAAGGDLPDRLPRRAGGEGPRRAPGPQPGRPPGRRASTSTGSSTSWGSGCRPPKAPSSGPGSAPSCATAGVRDVLIVCCDGLTGFPEAIEATWPQATVQTCTVHLIRAAMRFVSYRTARRSPPRCARSTPPRPSRPPKPSCWPSPTPSWAASYPATVATWENAWERFIPFLAFPPRSARSSTRRTRSSR